MDKKIGLASDHAGFEMKQLVKSILTELDYEIVDFGCYTPDRVDYPDYAHKLGKAIDEGELTRGIALCGSGNGISMALNKHAKVRAALSWTEEIAQLGRAHNDANVLTIPARFITEDECRKIVMAFLTTDFEGGRHTARVCKI